MRNTSPNWTLMLGLALIAASSAHAQVAAGTSTTGIAQVEVRAKAEYKLAPHEFEAYVGSYRFDSGETP